LSFAGLTITLDSRDRESCATTTADLLMHETSPTPTAENPAGLRINEGVRTTTSYRKALKRKLSITPEPSKKIKKIHHQR
jgi:hypothetical protein